MDTDNERRFFNKSEKVLLYVAADGKCQRCGQPLSDDFHADHRMPYSQGGETDIANAEALCPKCNLSKGGRGMLPEWTAPLREWQEDAFNDFQSQAVDRRDYLLVATPGSGKTRVALRIAHYLFQRGQIERLVIVTPTSHLRGQWADEANRLAGIQLDPDWKGPTEHEGMNGIAVTYQLVAMGHNNEAQRLLVSRKKTLVILDEIHHAGEQRTWGDAIQRSYELADYRLLLSGTPFRSDNFPIAFVNYDTETGICKPDFIYCYGKALKDDVCREILFPSFNGRIEYMLNGEIINVSFDDSVDETGGSNRLRMALSPKGDWIKQVLAEADKELSRIRKEQEDAAGLVITIDQRHACDVADLLQSVTGNRPIIAISDEPNSSEYIKAFRVGKQPWLVAVRMVSEGVDIPRLRVGVYATNVTSELYFRQAVGRFVRMQKDYEDQTAYFYIPEDPRLIEFAREIKVERQHAIEELEQYELSRDRDQQLANPSDLTLIESKAQEGATIYNSDTFPPAELERARLIARQSGVRLLEFRVDVVTVAKILRTVAPMGEEQQKRVQIEMPLYERLERLRRIYNRNVNYLAAMSKKDQKQIHVDCHFIDGKWVKNKDCTEKELRDRIQYLKEQIALVIKKGREDGRQN